MSEPEFVNVTIEILVLGQNINDIEQYIDKMIVIRAELSSS